MRTPTFLIKNLIYLLVLVCALACGSDEEGIALVGGTASGSFEGQAFEVRYGFAAINDEGKLTVAVGDGRLNCSHVEGVPPEGTYAQIQLPAAVSGTPESHSVSFSRINGNDLNFSIGTGTVDIVTVLELTDMTVNMMVEYASESHSLSGTFEVERCL